MKKVRKVRTPHPSKVRQKVRGRPPELPLAPVTISASKIVTGATLNSITAISTFLDSH